MTATKVAIDISIIFMSGKTAVFSHEFCFTLAATVVISGFMALTLSPMMCAHSLGSARRNHYEISISDVFKKLEKGYAALLTQVLQMQVWLIGIFMILVITSIGLFRSIPTALEPNDNR